MAKSHAWQYEAFTILQILPPGDYCSVWFYEATPEKPATIFVERVNLLALARVVTYHYERDEGGRVDSDASTPRREIVSLSLEGGYFHIDDECSNFAGLVLLGDDPRSATGCLSCRTTLPDFESIHVEYSQRIPLGSFPDH